MEGIINPKRSSSDLVKVEPYGDGRWFLAYLQDWQPPDAESCLFVNVYAEEDGKIVGCGYAPPYERVGLLW